MDKKNIKKSFSKALKFIESKSFYLVLVLCLGIVVFAGLFITSKNIISSIDFEANELFDDVQFGLDNLEFRTDVGGDMDKATSHKGISSTTNLGLDEQTAISTDDRLATSIENEEDLEAKAQASSIIEEKDIEFELPVAGKIIFDYSMDKPIYSKTLNDWRTHAGVDIGASLGTPVKAAADGIVKEVKNDSRFGYTVVIEHGKTLTSVYASLGKEILVKENQKVKVGEIIGSVGNSAPFEILKSPHIHFEILKDGKNEDPKDYLPQLAE
jgi:murein DD-endopeptidase MepM/ murein hydrolase activator NlpD